MSIGFNLLKRALVIAAASASLAGCVAYPAPYYASAPGYDNGYYAAVPAPAPAPIYAAPAPYYYAPPVYGGIIIGGGGGGYHGRGWGHHYH